MSHKIEGRAQEIVYDPDLGFGCAEVVAGNKQIYISFEKAVFPNKNRLLVELFEDALRMGRSIPHLVEITGQTTINGRLIHLEAWD